MLSMLLFISGGEIFLILFAILMLFGADKIPEFARMMGKGVREFKKATDDIKRELNESSSGVMNDIQSIKNDMSDTFTKELANPVQKTVDETAHIVEEYQNTHDPDYYYENKDHQDSQYNEYATEIKTGQTENTDQVSSGTTASEETNDDAKPNQT